ncbi:MAG: hypothetical protein AAF943_00505 [Pseudomonadota bacterium]
MPRTLALAAGIALPLCLAGQGAFADLTPQQVWTDWKTYMQGVGYTVEGSESVSGGDLTISEIKLSFDAPDGQGDMEVMLDQIAFQQNGDGSVAIVFPDTLPIKVSGTEGFDGGDAIDISMVLTQSGHSMVASGDPNDLTYAYEAATVGLSLDQVMVDGDAVEAGTAKMNVTGTSVSNTTTMILGEMRNYKQSSSIEEVSYSLAVDTPEDGGQQVDMSGTLQGLSVTGEGQIPLTIPEAADMVTLLDAGLDVVATISFQNGSGQIDAQTPEDGNFSAQTSSKSGAFSVNVNDTALGYAGEQKNLQISAKGGTFPFPVEFAMAENAFNLSFPVRKAEEPQDFAVGVKMGEFTMSEILWGFFDPQAQLPRDPATIALDLTGQMKLLVDFMDPSAGPDMMGAPGELKALNLNQVLVDAVGAKLEGSGAITMDGDAPGIVPGVGSPVGSVDLALSGANGLIDTLIAMGILPQEQAMGARMMMGVFAVPGDGPDTLKSKIDFTKEGQILANGQRIR